MKFLLLIPIWLGLCALAACVPPTEKLAGESWPSVKEFSHKGHDYLMSVQGHIVHAEHCWNMSHVKYQTNWVTVRPALSPPD
jgi:hypothetical protein